VEGCRWGVIPERGRQGASRLRILLRARLQPPRGGFLLGHVVLLQLGAGTSRHQLYNCSFDLHSLL
jgi:hypothetical protein